MKTVLDNDEQEIEDNAESFVPVSFGEKEHIETLLQNMVCNKVFHPNEFGKS